MGNRLRSIVVLSLAFLLLFGVMPATAFGAVTLTHAFNWGSHDDTFPYADGMFHYPADVAADKYGNVFVSGGENGDDRVQMFTPAGAFVKSVGPALSPTLLAPAGLATDRWANSYITEKATGASRIRVLGEGLWDGGYLPWGPISNPWHLGLALDGTAYVTSDGQAVEVWDREYLDEWGGTDRIFSAVDVSQDGDVYVTNTSAESPPWPYVISDPNSVLRYTLDGTYVGKWGGAGSGAGQFTNPYDVGTDGAGNVYVLDNGNRRIQVFDADGNYLTQVGSSGGGDQQFSSPLGIGVGFDRTVYVADTFNHRVSKWKVSVPTATDQVAGGNRITTAIEASKKAYPDGADFAILSTGANWPDALGGAALAGAVNGPLLLVDKYTLPAEVAAEIDRLNATYIYVLGGTGAVSDPVFNAAKALTPLNAGERLGGASRYETAILIAREMKQVRGSDYDGTAFVCTGVNFPDALAAAPIAAANGWPIYLTPPDHVPAAVIAGLAETHGGNPSNHGYLIGGPSAVSDAALADLNAVFHPGGVPGYGRISGGNRYDTAAELAEIGFDGMGMLFSRPALATGENFPDALAGGVLQGSDACPLLLTRSASLSPEAAALLTKYKDHVYEIRFMGGNAAISPAVQNAAKALLW